MKGFHKMMQIRPVQLIHCKDEHSEYWLLDGIGKKRGARLAEVGFTWIRGKPGAWSTSHKEIAELLVSKGVPMIESVKNKTGE
jgi:hypothetical protein